VTLAFGRLSIRTSWPAENVAVAVPPFAMSIVQIQAVPAATVPETLFDLTAVRSGVAWRIGSGSDPPAPAIAATWPGGVAGGGAANAGDGEMVAETKANVSSTRTANSRLALIARAW